MPAKCRILPVVHINNLSFPEGKCQVSGLFRAYHLFFCLQFLSNTVGFRQERTKGTILASRVCRIDKGVNFIKIWVAVGEAAFGDMGFLNLANNQAVTA